MSRRNEHNSSCPVLISWRLYSKQIYTFILDGLVVCYLCIFYGLWYENLIKNKIFIMLHKRNLFINFLPQFTRYAQKSNVKQNTVRIILSVLYHINFQIGWGLYQSRLYMIRYFNDSILEFQVGLASLRARFYMIRLFNFSDIEFQVGWVSMRAWLYMVGMEV